MDAQADALKRLLAEGRAGGEARTDALNALSEATVWVATWPDTGEFRTLENARQEGALPIFSCENVLKSAAAAFGWSVKEPNSHCEVHAQEAFRHVLDTGLSHLIIDISSEYSLQVSAESLRPCLTREDARTKSGPSAARGRISEPVPVQSRPSPARSDSNPERDDVGRDHEDSQRVKSHSAAAAAFLSDAPTQEHGGDGERTSQHRIDRAAFVTRDGADAADVPTAKTLRLTPPQHIPSDAFVNALHGALKQYPEVEWAVLVDSERKPSGVLLPGIGLRVDSQFRTRLRTVFGELEHIAAEFGVAIDLFLLDDSVLAKAGRKFGVPLHPWLKKRS